MGEEESRYPIDIRIKNTVGNIIEDFLESYAPQGILLVNYDDYDSKQEKRFLCFDKWYNDLSKDGRFYKEDTEIILPSISIKVSMILSVQHENFKAVLQEFHETKDKLIEEK